MIAHRLSTVRKADSIIVLNRGEIVEQGTWQSLLSRPGSLFAGMCRLVRSEWHGSALPALSGVERAPRVLAATPSRRRGLRNLFFLVPAPWEQVSSGSQ